MKLGGSLDEAYRAAALQALQGSNQAAIVVIRQEYEQLPDADNPYYSAKAALLSQGVTVQAVKIETVRKQNAYILNTIGLAVYAKLGGVRGCYLPRPAWCMKLSLESVVHGLERIDVVLMNGSSELRPFQW